MTELITEYALTTELKMMGTQSYAGRKYRNICRTSSDAVHSIERVSEAVRSLCHAVPAGVWNSGRISAMV